jgi:hypothetical protein
MASRVRKSRIVGMQTVPRRREAMARKSHSFDWRWRVEDSLGKIG